MLTVLMIGKRKGETALLGDLWKMVAKELWKTKLDDEWIGEV